VWDGIISDVRRGLFADYWFVIVVFEELGIPFFILLIVYVEIMDRVCFGHIHIRVFLKTPIHPSSGTLLRPENNEVRSNVISH
jgi:hypothetical protein